MKIRADEHVSPKIIRALRDLVLNPAWELSHVREMHGTRTADETWVAQFAADGGRGIITADATMLKRPHQRRAIQSSGVAGVVLPRAWAMARRHIQASALLFHWPQIEDVLATAAPGEFWRMPTRLHRGPLERVRIGASRVSARGAS